QPTKARVGLGAAGLELDRPAERGLSINIILLSHQHVAEVVPRARLVREHLQRLAVELVSLLEAATLVRLVGLARQRPCAVDVARGHRRGPGRSARGARVLTPARKERAKANCRQKPDTSGKPIRAHCFFSKRENCTVTSQ